MAASRSADVIKK